MTGQAVPLELDDDFDTAEPAVSWVMTDAQGMLLEASREAAEMLNLSAAGLRRRQLVVFFDGERDQWLQALRAAAAGLTVYREGAVRRRDKRPLRVRVEIAKAPCPLDAVLWTFTEPDRLSFNP